MCGGDSSKTDRKAELFSRGQLQDVAGTLRGFAGDLFGSGKDATKSGMEDTNKASKYYSDILSGDPTKVLAAAQPEVKAITGDADQQKKLATASGDRTGGNNAGMQDLASRVRGQIADVISGKRSGAAGGLERTGAQKSNVGLGEEGLAIGAEGTAGSEYASLIGDAIKSRELSKKIHDQAVDDWSKVVSGLLGIGTSA